MKRQPLLVMLFKGGLEDEFEEAKKAYTIVNGDKPDRYCVPQYLYAILEILQENKPVWDGSALDPWAKDEIRGQ